MTSPELAEFRRRLKSLETRVCWLWHSVNVRLLLMYNFSKTARCCSRSCISLGVTTRWRFSRFVCSHKRTNMHQISCTSCESSRRRPSLYCSETDTSADLEVTVALLVQIDKLVQLIESPVFTCEFYRGVLCSVGPTRNPNCRPETTTPRAGEISVPFQVFVRPIDAAATKFGVCLSEKQA